MEEKLEALYQYILEAKKTYVAMHEFLAEKDRDILKEDLWKIIGMEEAYKILAGKSWSDRQIELFKASCPNAF